MTLKRSNAIFSDGERFVTLVDEKGIPDFWVHLFLTTKHRSKASSTNKGYVGHLVHFKLWDDAQPEPFLEKVLRLCDEAEENAKGWLGFVPPAEFLSHAEVVAIYAHCSFTTLAVRRRLKRKKRKSSNIMQLQAAMPTVAVPDPTVSSKQHKSRMRTVKSFVRFVLESALRTRKHYADYLTLIDNADEMLSKQLKEIEEGNGGSGDPDLKAPLLNCTQN
ncbi:MAG: hypothetical protein ABW090_14220 [Sedimenticola sp.]